VRARAQAPRARRVQRTRVPPRPPPSCGRLHFRATRAVDASSSSSQRPFRLRGLGGRTLRRSSAALALGLGSVGWKCCGCRVNLVLRGPTDSTTCLFRPRHCPVRGGTAALTPSYHSQTSLFERSLLRRNEGSHGADYSAATGRRRRAGAGSPPLASAVSGAPADGIVSSSGGVGRGWRAPSSANSTRHLPSPFWTRASLALKRRPQPPRKPPHRLSGPRCPTLRRT